MPFVRSPLCRAGIAAVLALALAGCAAQGTAASAVMLSGGGSVSDHREAESSGGSSEPETPSFQELPSSESSSSGEAAPPPSSSSDQASSAAPSSSEAPPVSSQPEPEQPVEEEPEEQDPDDDDGYDQDDPDDDDQDYDVEYEEPEEDEPDDDDDRYGQTGDWEDLKVRSGGSTVSGSAVSIVGRIVQTEMGSSFPDEAIKAQAVAAYTFVRYHNSVAGDIPSVILSDPSRVTDKVDRLVREVAGEQITYNGKPILATYCSSSAGVTTSSQSVWGSSLPYLVAVKSEGDRSNLYYGSTTTISAGVVKSKLENYLNVDLNGVSPKMWFDILSYWDGGPYVNKVSIAGQKETTGRVIRESILNLRSAAFEVEYNGSDFIFTTYGYGHGVGMSQLGAKYYADQGWDYVDILEHYYSGATVG